MSVAALEPVYQQIPTWEETGRKEQKDDLGKNQFLTMLVAQLQNQDPLNPLDGTDFTAQLAQFSGLEQQVQMNDNLAQIQDALHAQEKGNAIDYIGKTVKTENDVIVAKDGQASSGTYSLTNRAQVSLYIYDDQGIEIRRIYKGWQDAGEQDIAWDGLNNSGDAVPDGTYHFEIEAKDEQGLFVPYTTYVTGQVTGVTFDNGVAYLKIGDRSVSPSNIVQISQTDGSDSQ